MKLTFVRSSSKFISSVTFPIKWVGHGVLKFVDLVFSLVSSSTRRSITLVPGFLNLLSSKLLGSADPLPQSKIESTSRENQKWLGFRPELGLLLKAVLVSLWRRLALAAKSLTSKLLTVYGSLLIKVKNYRMHLPDKLPSLSILPKFSLPPMPVVRLPAFPRLKAFIKTVSVYLLGFISALVFVMAPFEVYQWFMELPRPEMLLTESYSQKPTRILDRNGNLLYEIYLDKKYDYVELSKIPPDVINSTIAVEDAEFYSHHGIRLSSIVRAFKANYLEGSPQGGSTITQQLIKNVLLTPERTLSRKAKEAVLALLVESKYSKDEILEMYFNNIPYGGTSWGVQAASQKFFGKNVWELNLAEAAMLAGLPSSPTTYSPLTDLALAKQRQRVVLQRMVELGYVSQPVADAAYEEELAFVQEVNYIRAPHFVEYVKKELYSKYGKRLVDMGGLTVTTTLDLSLHDKVQDIVTEEVSKGSRLNFTNGAAVVLDSRSGEILSYVGSVNYFGESWGAFDVASAYRQPGSSIKPVTYALALASGSTPATILKDTPVTYQVPGSRPYSPVNYDGRYHGDVTLRAALANSYNIPAVRLARQYGPDNIVSLGKELGLRNWAVDGNYGLAVTLGGKEVRLVDLTNVYATFARQGTYTETTPLLSVVDSKGYELYNSSSRQSREVLSKEVSYLVWHILSDNAARTPAFGSNSALVIPNQKVAVKTGTTDEKRDNWTIGFTPSYAVGVWVGNNDNQPMNRFLASGLTGAAPIWNRIFSTVLEGKQAENMSMPDAVFVRSDSECGRSEVFIKGSNVPSRLCPEQNDDDEDEDKMGDGRRE